MATKQILSETKIGFGATVLARGLANNALDGIGTYTLELGRALAAQGNIDIVPTLFGSTDRHVDEVFGDEKTLHLRRFATTALGTALCGVSLFDSKKANTRFSLYHATDHLIPKLRGVPVVATIMDAIPLSHPEWIRQNQAALKRWLFRRTASWADHIITISEFSKREIVEHFNVPPERVSVTPLGVDERYFERVDEQTSGTILKKFSLPRDFFLFIGTLQPRKNVETLLAAHRQLPVSLRRQHPLVVVGRAGWNCDGLVASMREPENDGLVFWLNYVSDLEKRALMSCALGLSFVSLYEGFGLPVIEAFAAQLPVITANTSSLVEVTGDAALSVNPTDPAEIAQAMVQLATDNGLRTELIDKGLARARHYTWARCAEATRQIYKSRL